MGLRRFLAAAVVVGGSGLMAGCPELGGQWGNGDIPYGVISDGTYSGTKNATTKYWQDGETFWSGDWDESVSVEFYDGAIVQPSGDWLDYGDVDSLNMGTLQFSREVDEIYFEDWGYEVFYDLTGEWDGVPFVGVQHVDYVAEDDGSVTVYDTIELTSEDSFDGGEWEIVIEAEGTLSRSRGGSNPGNPGNPLDDDILDRKSGKIRQDPGN